MRFFGAGENFGGVIGKVQWILRGHIRIEFVEAGVVGHHFDARSRANDEVMVARRTDELVLDQFFMQDRFAARIAFQKQIGWDIDLVGELRALAELGIELRELRFVNVEKIIHSWPPRAIS